MPRKRWPQSPAEAANSQNLAKRQKKGNDEEGKINVDIKQSSSAARSRPPISDEEWTIGSPLPARIIPPLFQPSSQFRPQAVEKLDGHNESIAVNKWKLSESRPPFARLLCLEKLQENEWLLAAYLGFDTVQQLNYFAYFDAISTLTHLIRIYYPDYRQRQSAAYTNPREIFPPASKVWERFRTLLEGNLNWLKSALDTSRPDQILVSSRQSRQELVGDERNISLKDIDPILSILAASYKLAKAYPNRFCQQQPQKPIEHIWGLHHEDWMRAYAMVVFACGEHVWYASRFETNPSHASFGNFTALAEKAKKSASFGYITDELLSQFSTPGESDKMAAMQLYQTIDYPELERRITKVENLSRLASKDDIEYTINALGLFQSKTAAERDGIVQDTDGALSEIVTKAVYATLGTIAPGTDLDKELNSSIASIKTPRYPTTESDKEALRALLNSRVCLAQYDMSRQTALDDYNRRDDLPPVIDTRGAGLPDETNETTSSVNTIDLEKMRKARARLGENLPPNQDLTSICSLRGIDVTTLSINSYISKSKARPPHIIDANRLAELLGGPLRTAILHSDLSTGTTLVASLAARFLIDEKINTFDNGMLHFEEADRVFKPSIVFEPIATLRYYFRKMKSWWEGIFHISLHYEASESWVNEDGISNVIDNTTELQKHVDRWAAEHRDSKTARTILLTSYEAGVKFMLDPKVKPQRGQQIQDAATQKQHDANSVLGEVASKYDDENKRKLDETDSSHFSNSEQDASAQSDDGKKTVHNDMWNLVILDQCHLVKKETTSHYKLVRQLDRDALLLVSSTPMTTLKDVYGYLRLMWDSAWPFSYSRESDSGLNTAIYNPETYQHLLRRESTHEAIRKQVIAGGAALDTLTPRQRQRRAEYIKFILEGSGPAYLLHPELFKGFWQSNRLDVSATALAAKKVLEMVSVRRGLLTPMRLPNGDIKCIGEGIGGLTVRTVEISSTDSDSVKKRLDSHISELLKKSEDLKVKTGEVEAMLDSAACRQLSMVSTDANNIALTAPTKGLLNLLSTFQGSSIPSTPTKGLDYTNWLAGFDTTGGLKWLFYHTRESQKYSFSQDRLSLVRYAAWDSPKYCYVLLRALEAQKRDEKLFVCVNNPLTSQIINALLVTCGIKTIHCTPRHSELEKREAVAAFTDTQSTHTCLVGSMQLFPPRLGLQKCCHKGIIMELPTTHSALLNTIGLLWIPGQKQHVEWEILIAKHSFDAFIEGSILKEYSAVVAATANIDAAITGEARMICAYEIVREQFGQEYSRYPRMRAPWNEMDGEDIRREGYFYSALAEFFVQNPDQAFLVGRYNIRQIAMAWKAGMEITVDMVKQPVALEAGEGLALRYL